MRHAQSSSYFILASSFPDPTTVVHIGKGPSTSALQSIIESFIRSHIYPHVTLVSLQMLKERNKNNDKKSACRRHESPDGVSRPIFNDRHALSVYR